MDEKTKTSEDSTLDRLFDRLFRLLAIPSLILTNVMLAYQLGYTRDVFELKYVNGELKFINYISASPAKSAASDLAPGTARTFDGIDFVWIPPGTFTMGSPTSESHRDDDATQHEVTISRGFWLGKYEVTKEQWYEARRTRPWDKEEILVWEGTKFVHSGNNYPAVFVSWDDIQVFLNALNKGNENIYRLPTEAEWEYACRAGTTTAYSFGDSESDLGSNGWFNKNARDNGEQYAHLVGQKGVNAFGLYDMHGNVFEWCNDWSGDYPNGSATDPTGPSSGNTRVFRGGSWMSNAHDCRSASRNAVFPTQQHMAIGFRVVRTQK